MTESSRSRRIAVQLIGGMVVGAAVGAGLAMSGALDIVLGWRANEVATGIIGIMLLAVAAVLAAGGASPALYRRLIDRSPEQEPVEAADLVFVRRQAIVAALGGVLLLAVPFAAHAGLGTEGRVAAAVAVFALLAVQTVFNIRLWREGDELTRRVIADSGAISFWLLQFALFAWATLVMLDLAPEIESWTSVAVLMAVYLVASSVVAFRRGFGSA